MSMKRVKTGSKSDGTIDSTKDSGSQNSPIKSCDNESAASTDRPGDFEAPVVFKTSATTSAERGVPVSEAHAEMQSAAFSAISMRSALTGSVRRRHRAVTNKG